MKVDVNKVNEYTREFHVDISWMELKDDFNVSLKKFSRKIKMPGFRPGKVPRERLLQQFQPNIEADFMEDNFQKYYLMAVQQEEIIPVNKAEISDVHFHMNEHFSFKAQFEIEPDNTLPRFKKNMLRVQKTNYIHDEQDIEDAIDQLRKSHARIQTIDDGAREGDFIICTLQKLDESGLPIIGKKYEKQYLKVGDGSFTDEQKERLIGLKTDEKTRLTLPINKEGDHAEYELTVNNVEREILPDLDDDFLRLVNPELSSLDALHDEVEKKIQANFEERSQTAFERDL
ncbi:MAG: trigger factor, partial [Candidatus Neomarinimicrobiota bacterium]|nr:trigger factor [Candidatus Neomarinimicrobiota bacterium]